MGQAGPVVFRDGGHDAIRGFAFQFDATLLEAFDNPTAVVEVEGDQDISRDDFYIQVKFHSNEYFFSRVAKPIRQILEQFAGNTDRRYRLYCHFEGRVPGTSLQLTLEQLDQALGKEGFNLC